MENGCDKSGDEHVFHQIKAGDFEEFLRKIITNFTLTLYSLKIV